MLYRQFLIWSPWLLFFAILIELDKRLNYLKPTSRRNKIIGIIGFGIILHIGWFFLISSNFSPYKDLSRACYSAYPYVFILWTTIDLVIAKIVYNKLKPNNKQGINKVGKQGFSMTREGSKFICKSDDIFWLKSQNYQTKINTKFGDFLIRKSLKYYETELPENKFIRIHRGVLINKDYVKQFIQGNNNTLTIIMQDETEFIVSRRLLKPTRDFFNKCMR